ncbi:deoxyguanosinetriphosphate triphosphohydrolase family protein [Saccharopolyspora mangrovi]|uniref:DNTP triphosphohydrolase n=1 Tax=Saccharopolyspora mangrovi TaxID=3082379 RepID=A0ABU6A6M9_9PSEU|nr:dNTP triphosphohydrolase [Saccharopolyspora sp. S2-29]MEB3367112.1 dNTP triphosphohydrolase [Saccharopolyspora sp. S2-29]
MEEVQPRAARRSDRTGRTMPGDLAASPFRADRDRISASAFFARLGGVTQVVSPSGSGLLLHNRLTHSLKVSQVARAIAERLLADPVTSAQLDGLGGCDLDVVEAAGLGHDLGHPPFGHLGESVLDRLARERFALPDGFEGNAQTYRVVTRIDVRGVEGNGLDLTAAVRSALLKYPWTRHSPVPRQAAELPRGASEPAGMPGSGAAKFSAYSTELDDLLDARAPFEKLVPEWQQTVEASIMDTADDIAYAIHDLEDFHRVGILQFTTVHHELQEWLGHSMEFAAEEHVAAGDSRPGASLELLRRRIHAKDAWIADDEAFADAVKKVRTDLAVNLLEMPFDRSQQAEQAVVRFSGDWTRRLVEGIRVDESVQPRSAHVALAPEQWHEVQVLKFVHRHFVLQRPDLALHQRGQDRLISNLVEALDEWLIDEVEVAPHRLRDLFDLARQEFDELPTELLPPGANLATLARGRAVIDFVASLTDDQAAALLEAVSGRTTQLWNDTFVL